MLNIVVNGTAMDFGEGATPRDVVALWCTSPDGIAVAVNDDVVPHSAWSTRILVDGDRIEIVTAAAGG